MRKPRARPVRRLCIVMTRQRARTIRTALLASCCAIAGGCGADFHVCDPPSPAVQASLPERLSETGLYADIATDAVAGGVEPFAPQFELWSDGATKRRWMQLPAGAQIDTSAMDAWNFPVGTKLWKEFSRDGVRVETRLLYRTGPQPDEWAAVAYLWQPELGDAVIAPEGMVDAGGTEHDVPSASQCTGCHGGRTSRVLGVSAVQLAYDAAASGIDLDLLAARGSLTVVPSARPVIPGDDTARNALGYIHANCGHCHNQDRPPRTGARCFDPENRLDFWLRVDELGDVASTPTYRSAIDDVIEPGDPDGSALIKRVSRRGDPHFVGMPPLGTERVDDAAVALLRRWIQEMPR
jgi:hypothetical protein